MFGAIVELVSNALGIAKGWIGLQSKKLDLKNTAEMRAAAERGDELKAADVASEAIAKQDVQEIREELSE